MRSTIRTIAACLLMLLLPLQGFASAVSLRTMDKCPMMAKAAVQDDCLHGMHDGRSDGHAPQAKLAAPHDTHASDSNSCDMGMNCPALGAPGMVSATSLFTVIPGAASLHAAIEPHYSSHVPEGLQRPPRQAA